MKNLIGLLLTLILIGCNESKKEITEFENGRNLTTEKASADINQPYNISFDSTQVSNFTIEHSELTKSKALDKKMSEYSTTELEELPEFKRLTIGIVVPFDISKESLINTMKFITSEKAKADYEIDEIMIFAYDDKKDLTNGGGFYTFGKLLWAPSGKTGNVTSKIAKDNIRDSYKFEIDIKDKVGKIEKSNLPTKLELEIYNTIMAEENIGMDEEKLNRMVMKKFNISTEKELNAIWLKVATYKN